jgi:hypothetical protein
MRNCVSDRRCRKMLPMVNQTREDIPDISKADMAAALQAAGIPRKSFSIRMFCGRNGISEGFYRKMRSHGLGPRETRILDRVFISEEAETDWRREREAASQPVA